MYTPKNVLPEKVQPVKLLESPLGMYTPANVLPEKVQSVKVLS